jgi:hypothetical protein
MGGQQGDSVYKVLVCLKLTVLAGGVGRKSVLVLVLVLMMLVVLYLLDDLIEKAVEKLVRILAHDAPKCSFTSRSLSMNACGATAPLSAGFLEMNTEGAESREEGRGR